jgi:hypothetical protein
MITYNNIYSLATGKEHEQFSISDIRVDYEGHKKGNPYNTTFCVDVTSGYFKGRAYFEYDIADFISFINGLRDLYDF